MHYPSLMPAKPAKRKSPPYLFILEALEPLAPEVRPMFSGYAVYVQNKIVFMLRDSAKQPEDNGLWVVFADVSEASHAPGALRHAFPSIRPIKALGGKIHHWLLIPADSPHFEADSLRACEFALARDPRLGRIPDTRK